VHTTGLLVAAWRCCAHLCPSCVMSSCSSESSTLTSSLPFCRGQRGSGWDDDCERRREGEVGTEEGYLRPEIYWRWIPSRRLLRVAAQVSCPAATERDCTNAPSLRGAHDDGAPRQDGSRPPHMPCIRTRPAPALPGCGDTQGRHGRGVRVGTGAPPCEGQFCCDSFSLAHTFLTIFHTSPSDLTHSSMGMRPFGCTL